MEKYLYEDLYNIEDSHWWHVSKRETVFAMIKRFLKVKKPIILDMGCGTGKNIELLKKFGNVYGIDKSEEAIRYCKKRGLRNVELGSIYNTSYKKSSFELITLLDVLEHTQEEKTLREISRLLTTDGVLVLTVPAYTWLWSHWDVLQHHKKRYSQKDLRELLEKSGFKVLKISYMFSFLVLPLIFVRVFKNIFFKNNYSSDFKLTFKFLDRILVGVSDLERWLIVKCNIPFGTSIVCVAQRN